MNNNDDNTLHNTQQSIENYGSHFSTAALWDKIKAGAEKAGATVIFSALLLYNVLRSPSTPLADKALVTGALGYFILPVDLIADILPGIGFTDDAAAMTAALITVASNLTPEVVQAAKQQLHQWLPNIDDTTLDAVVEAVRKGALLKRRK
ncbi:MAG: DUF1232 domain-containing protein [Bacteroidales bacterium]|nr:DUF1232 domain-containing protein [Bacteroidales bacterium]